MNIDKTPISELKKIIESSNIESWESLDAVTLMLELNIEPSGIAVDKISVLQVMKQHPGIFYDDVLFFIHAVSVCNNKQADFEYVFIPNSLEVGYAIFDISKTYPGEFSESVKLVLDHILTEEGYSKVPSLFPQDLVLSEGQTKEDILAKDQALKMYITSMYKGI